MSDITERLRNVNAHGDPDEANFTMGDAADEIDRLRAALRRLEFSVKVEGGGDAYACPCCGRAAIRGLEKPSTHAGDCELAALLREADGTGEAA